MKKTAKAISPVKEQDETMMEKIGHQVSHLKDVIVEQKDQLVEAVENKVVAVKKVFKNFKRKKKTPPKKKTPAKLPAKTARKVAKKSATKRVTPVAKRAGKKKR